MTSALTMGSALDQWPDGQLLIPGVINASKYLNIDEELAKCRLADNTLLKEADPNSLWYKAYKYWIDSPSNDSEWLQLKQDAPHEVKQLGRYLITVRRLNIYAQHPEKPSRHISYKEKIVCVFLIALAISLIALSIIYLRKKNQ